MVVVEDIDEAAFNNKLLEFFDKQIENGHVSFATRFYYSNGYEDIRTVMRKVDERMYEDKLFHYQRRSFLENKK